MAFADPFTAPLVIRGDTDVAADEGEAPQDLPRTGAGMPLGWMTAAGAASIAAGIAIVRRRQGPTPTEEEDAPA